MRLTTTDSGASALDRLIKALQPSEATVYHLPAIRRSHGQTKDTPDLHGHPPSGTLSALWSRWRRGARLSVKQQYFTVQIAARAAERDAAVTALARTVLEQYLDQAVSELQARLDQEVEELEAARQQAAHVEGEREPDDPYSILQILPEGYRGAFLSDYRAALRAAYPAEGYLALRRMLKRWRKAAETLADSAYQDEENLALQAAETGDFSRYVPAEEVLRQARL